MTTLKTAEYLEVLAHEGDLMREAAERAGLAAPVPSCPGWLVRDLLAHQGRVHRWATRHVAEELRERAPMEQEPVPDAELTDWFRDGHRQLLTALREAPDGLECFTFLGGSPDGRHFWARRQAHETTVHRVDAELAAGGPLSPVGSPVGAAFAADGTDELLTGFHGRSRSRVRSSEPRTLLVRATDVPGAAWTARITEEPLQVLRGAEGPYDCAVSGPAAALYLALWNRRPLVDDATGRGAGEVTLEGDVSVARLWQTTGAV